jgi:hypothetical protein
MADTKDKDTKQGQDQAAPQVQPVNEIEVLKAQIQALQDAINGKAVAQAQEAANDGKPATETVSGGLYLQPDGKTLVNAYGRKVDKEGKPLSEDDAYLERPFR